MNGQIKVIDSIFKSKTLNKEQVINSSKLLRKLYETLLN